jgi:hypothetical protein
VITNPENGHTEGIPADIAQIPKPIAQPAPMGQVQMCGVTGFRLILGYLCAEGAEFGCLFLLVCRDKGEA